MMFPKVLKLMELLPINAVKDAIQLVFGLYHLRQVSAVLMLEEPIGRVFHGKENTESHKTVYNTVFIFFICML